MKRNIVLTGFMGTGKSRVGKILAEKLGYAFIDIDTRIEAEQKKKISEIFEGQGEACFREMEADMIRRIADMEGAVIATGGGAILRDDNVANLTRKGVIVCLTASPETIFSRTGASKERPLLSTGDPLATIRQLLSSRKPYYDKSGIMIDTEGKSPLVVAEEILSEVETYE
jgi:shikimate kinase